MFSYELLQKFYDATSIPAQVYEGDRLLYSCMNRTLFPNPSYCFMLPYIGQQFQNCFVISPDYILSGYIQDSTSEQYLIIGPVCSYEIPRRHVVSLLKTLNVPMGRLDDYLQLLHSIPRLDIPAFRNTLEFLGAVFLPENNVSPIHVNYSVPNMHLDSTVEVVPDYHMTQDVENTVLRLIEFGKPDELAIYFDSIPSLNLHSGKLGPNALRSIKNTYIAIVAITSRTAIKGGADYDTILALTEYYIDKAERLALYSEVIELIKSTLISFAKKVSSYAPLNTDSAIVHSVEKLVSKKIYEKISSGDIARLLSVEHTYLCHEFKEKTGMTVGRYIQECKIREAQFLLTTTSLSLIEISEKLAYSSQQQFQTAFKKQTGMTPGTFRKENL